MSQTMDTGFTSVAGTTSILLQVHLGVGLLLGTLGSAIASQPEIRKRLEGSPWEATFRAVAKAVSPAPLLVAYALVQVRTAPADGLSTVGLFVSTAALCLGTFLAFLGVALGAELARASRVLSAISAFGHLLLVFGKMPIFSGPFGSELVTATAFLRLALFVRGFGAAGRALGAGVCSLAEAAESMEPIVALAPLVAGLALLDSIVWGQSGVYSFLFQAAPFCALLLLLVIMVRFTGSGTVKGSGRHTLDLAFEHEKGVATPLQTIFSKVTLAVFAMLVLTASRVVVGTFSVDVTSSGISVQWGDLLVASATKLLVLCVISIVAGGAFGTVAEAEEEAEEHAPINGTEVSAASTPLTYGKILGFTDYLKAVVAPAEMMALAALAVQSRGESASVLKYGFVFANTGIVLQVLCLVIHAAGAGRTTPPSFDAFGTVQWESQDGNLATGLRSVTNCFLQLGLLLGCLGLGAPTMILIFLSGAACLFALSPSAARSTGTEVVTMTVGSYASGVEKFLADRRKAQEAEAARKAAAVAQALEDEAEKLAKAAKQVKRAPTSAGGAKRKGK